MNPAAGVKMLRNAYLTPSAWNTAPRPYEDPDAIARLAPAPGPPGHGGTRVVHAGGPRAGAGRPVNGRWLPLAGRHWVPLFLVAVFLLMLGLRYVMQLPELGEGPAQQDALSARRAAAMAELWREVLLAVLAAVLLWVFLDVLWFRRARRMVAAVEDMGAGQLERRTGVAGADELGLIGRAVDRMAERLQHDQLHVQYMSDLINRSPAVVVEWRVAAGWSVLRISDGVAQWGYAPADFTASGRVYRDFVHPDDLDGVVADLGQRFSGREEHFTQAYRIRCADGRWAWVEDRTRIERDGQGVVVRATGILLDITDRRMAERARREREALVRRFFELPFIGMAISSPTDKRWLEVNGRLCEIMGYEREELLARTWAEMTHPDDVAANVGLFDELLAGRRDGYQMEKRFIRRDGAVVHTEMVVRAVYDTQGHLEHLFTTIQDVTERKRSLALVEERSQQLRQAEERLREANQALEQRVVERTEQLRKANQELEAFTYSVSHDLKAPLRGIDGYSQLLQEEHAPGLDEEGRLFVARIRRGVEQMGFLIEDLLDYSRMERRQMERQDVDVRPLVEQALESCAGDIERLGTQVDNRVGAMRLSVDREGLAVALRNLVGNAVKFSRDSTPPRIEIGAEEADGWRRIWVRDNGVGFDMKYYDRIFGIFQRLHRAEDYAGTGVGLALVAKAVERMGGRVRAESAPGQGAVFYLEFPSS